MKKNVVENMDDTQRIKRAFIAIEKLQSKLKVLEYARTEPIAIIGIGCRFPGGANNPDAYWQLLRDGVDAISEVPTDRWDVEAYYDPDWTKQGKINTRHSGFLNTKVYDFDPQFFGIAPREAMQLDPQQRLLLEVAWEALEYANIVPDRLFNSSTGVFIGISTVDYAVRQLGMQEPSKIGAYVGTGALLSPAAGRLSYMLGLTGPSTIVDTACSSSLLAVHFGCQSLRNKESDLVLSGGVNLILAPELCSYFSTAGMLSSDGRCKTFDAAANGYVRSEGCGVLVLKRLSDALADGDNILACLDYLLYI
jgi:acyl transferase domain-containing protein